MLAQVISQISSHFIIYYHRKIVTHAKDETTATQKQKKDGKNTATKHDDMEGQGDGNSGANDDEEEAEVHVQEEMPPETATTIPKSDGVAIGQTQNDRNATTTASAIRLYEHAYGRPHRGEYERLFIRPFVNPLLWVSAACIVITIILGCVVLPSFSLEFLGIFGIAVEAGQDFEQAVINHSLLSIIGVLLEVGSFLGTVPELIGLVTLSCLLFVTIFIVPLSQSALLLNQWFSSYTDEQRRRVALWNETLQAWQYAEVYILALLVVGW